MSEPPQRKRPAKRQRPAAATGTGTPVTLPPRVTTTDGIGGGGLLASLLGDVEDLKRQIGNVKPPKERIGGAMAEADEDRRRFQAEVERDLKDALVLSNDPKSFRKFAPMEKKWRGVIEDVAKDLNLPCTNIGEEPERYVMVGKTEAAFPGGSVHTRVAPKAVAREKKVSLSDMAPSSQDDLPDMVGGVVRLNTNKRDLRSIEEIQADMASGTVKKVLKT
ncbi:hypothetical protein CYMTET_27312 [Cymbomonas tetramitiformis]|uniref:R3H domain-containing protein n=1 Tax=Cymbomonas tetramitiformis TaxID=36881 RepID=A0AAE0KX10_9CHLO|nr:hypothetical protein CYMTET_27312 [Cymbomonas tetramitiformis]